MKRPTLRTIIRATAWLWPGVWASAGETPAPLVTLACTCDRAAGGELRAWCDGGLLSSKPVTLTTKPGMVSPGQRFAKAVKALEQHRTDLPCTGRHRGEQPPPGGIQPKNKLHQTGDRRPSWSGGSQQPSIQ